MNKVIMGLILLCIQSCSDAPETTIISKKVSKHIVRGSGEIESKITAMIAPPSVSRMWQYQIKKLIPENTQVKKGELLVSFDDKKVTDRLFDKQADLDRAKKEFSNKKIKEKALKEELILNLAEQKMEFEKAKRKAKIIDSSRSANDRRKAEIDFIIAKNDYFLAQEKLKYHQDNTDLNLKRVKGKVDRLTSEVNGFKRDIARLKVKAPIDGMVIYQPNWQGEKPAAGENIQFGQPVIKLAVIEKLQLKAQIEEPDSGKIKLGQSVKVSLDGTQEIVFPGTIITLGRVFRDKSQQDKSRIFDVVIAFEANENKLIRPGMTARIEVNVEDNFIEEHSTRVNENTINNTQQKTVAAL